MSYRLILPLAAGAMLTAACSKREPEASRPTMNPPEPQVDEVAVDEADPTAAPEPGAEPTDAAPPPIATNPPPPQPALPTWDDVPSSHPPGATNPPSPVLVVTPDGECRKLWQSPFAARQGARFEPHVRTDCADHACGTPIVCPPEAAGVLEAWKKEQEG